MKKKSQTFQKMTKIPEIIIIKKIYLNHKNIH